MKLRLIGLLVLINALWAPKNLAVKLGLESFNATTVGFLRWALFTLLLALLMLWPRFRELSSAHPVAKRERLPALLIGLLLFAPAHVLYYLGVSHSTSIETTVLHTTLPIWSALLSALVLHERVSARRWFAIFATGLGSYVVAMGFGAPSFRSANALGNGYYLLAVLIESFGIVLIARILIETPGIGVLLWQGLGIAIGFGAVFFLGMPELAWQASTPTPAAIGGIAYLILFPTLVCFTIWYKMVKQAPVSLIMLGMGLQPLLATLLGSLWLGEVIGPNTWAGGIAVMLALAFAASERPRRLVRAS